MPLALTPDTPAELALSCLTSTAPPPRPPLCEETLPVSLLMLLARLGDAVTASSEGPRVLTLLLHFGGVHALEMPGHKGCCFTMDCLASQACTSRGRPCGGAFSSQHTMTCPGLGCGYRAMRTGSFGGLSGLTTLGRGSSDRKQQHNTPEIATAAVPQTPSNTASVTLKSACPSAPFSLPRSLVLPRNEEVATEPTEGAGAGEGLPNGAETGGGTGRGPNGSVDATSGVADVAAGAMVVTGAAPGTHAQLQCASVYAPPGQLAPHSHQWALPKVLS